MKSIVLSLILLLTTMFAVVPQASAAEVFAVCNSSTTGSTDVCKTVKNQESSNQNPITKILKTVISILGIVIGIASVIVIMVAGFTFIINGGDPQAVARARNMLIYAVVGVVVAVLSESIVFFILNTVK